MAMTAVNVQTPKSSTMPLSKHPACEQMPKLDYIWPAAGFLP